MLLKNFASILGAGSLVLAHPHGNHGSNGNLKLWKKEAERLQQTETANEHMIEEIAELDDKVIAFFHAPAFERKLAELSPEQQQQFKRIKMQTRSPLFKIHKQYARLAEQIDQFDAGLNNMADLLGEEFKEMFEVQDDPCGDNPCLNGSKCVDAHHIEDWQLAYPDALYQCLCQPGWEGKNCGVNINDCESNQCVNGSCIDGIATFTCECDAGWEGELCDVNIDDCISNACVNGSCVDGIAAYTCSCNAGWDGEFCDNNIDECASNPCNPEGTISCTNNVDFWECICKWDWIGVTCENKVDHCKTDQDGNLWQQPPCFNGGTCLDTNNLVAAIVCLCPPEFNGMQCQFETNMCYAYALDYKCGHGKCVGAYRDPKAASTSKTNEFIYTCQCNPGYTGENCLEEIDACSSNPCGTYGQCHNFANKFSCNCYYPYIGTTCEYSEADNFSCTKNCINGGTCVSTAFNMTTLKSEYVCDCTNGFTGEFCEVDIDECANNPCQNGECIDGINQFTCQCFPGFQGILCDEDIDECHNNKECLNESECVNEINGFTCNCQPGFNGTFCENNIDECFGNPCKNGECIDGIDSYKCKCNPGWASDGRDPKIFGENCNKNIRCEPNPCQHGGLGEATPDGSDYTCNCDHGNWTGPLCTVGFRINSDTGRGSSLQSYSAFGITRTIFIYYITICSVLIALRTECITLNDYRINKLMAVASQWAILPEF